MIHGVTYETDDPRIRNAPFKIRVTLIQDSDMKTNQMFRTISLTVVCLILSSTNLAVAQKPFKNKTARAAQKTYEEAVAKAKAEYVAKLEIAVKEAGGAGDIEDAKILVAEKKRMDGSDPLTLLRRRLVGTKWNTNPKLRGWCLFKKNNIGVYHNGTQFAWHVTFENTVVFQNKRSLVIWVWHFDDELKKAALHRFEKSAAVAPGGKRIR